MATKNVKWFNEFSAKFGVQVQIIKGNDVTVHVAIIGNKKYTALAQLNKAQTEDLFKSISKSNDTVKENTVCVTSTGKVSLNGTRHNIYDVVKGIPVNRLLDVMDNSKRDQIYYGIGTWLLDDNNRKQYIRSIEYSQEGYDKWEPIVDSTLLKMYLDTGSREYAEDGEKILHEELKVWIPALRV